MGPGRAAGHEMCHQVPNASCCTVRLLKLQPLVERGLALSALPASVPRAGMKSALQYRLVYTLRNNRVALVVNVATADARRSQKLAIEVCNNQFRGSPTSFETFDRFCEMRCLCRLLLLSRARPVCT
jgi:hypothetical protein